MEEKYKKFKEYDWVNSEEWQAYYRNIFPTPPPSKVLRCKKKFYRNKIDSDFDIDYKPPEEEESNTSSSYSGSSTSSSSTHTNYNTNTTNQGAYSNEQTFENYKAAQYLARPIQSPLLRGLETLLFFAFFISLPLKYRTTLIGIIAFLVRTIRIVGIPQFNMTYFQAFILNDSCHTLFFTLQSLTDRTNYYMLLPVGISAIIAICDNLAATNLNIGGIKKYVDLVNNKREEITQSKSHIELAIGFVCIGGIFLKINSLLTPIIYWQLLRVRYTINPYTKQSFTELNNAANDIKNSSKCPEILKVVIEKVQSFFSYMGKINSPQNQNGQQQTNGEQGGGSMCNIF